MPRKTKTQRPDRHMHAGKSAAEKEDYRVLLGSASGFDKTAKDEIDTAVTNSSEATEESEEQEIKHKEGKEGEKRPGSIMRGIKDFASKNLAVILITVILGAGAAKLVDLVVSNNREVGEVKVELNTLSGEISIIKEKYDKGSIKTDFEVFKAEVKKDLEFLKSQVEKIQDKLSD